MSTNFLMRVEGIWRFTFLELMRHFWGWVFLTFAQLLFFSLGVAGLFLGVVSLIGFDSALICAQYIQTLEHSGAGEALCQPLLFFLHGISYKPLGFLFLLLGLFSFVYGLWLNFGVSRVAYRLSSPGALHEGLFRSVFSIRWLWLARVLGANLALVAIIVPGLFLLVIPGVFLMVRLIAVFPIMATNELCSIREALAESWRLTALSWRQVLWFMLGFLVLYLFMASFMQLFFSVTVFALARFGLFNELVAKDTREAAIKESGN